MLAYDLLNKYRQTSPISDCQILYDRLATIPCLSRLQTLIRADSLEIIHPVQGGGKNHTWRARYPCLRPVLVPCARDPSRILLLKLFTFFPVEYVPPPPPPLAQQSHSGRWEMRRSVNRISTNR